jgi:hypothetical protein
MNCRAAALTRCERRKSVVIGGDVRLDRRGPEQRRIGALDRHVDQGEGGHLLWCALFEHLEVILRQVANQGAGRIGDDRVDLDVIDLDLERDGWLLRRNRQAGGQHENGNEQWPSHVSSN